MKIHPEYLDEIRKDSPSKKLAREERTKSKSRKKRTIQKEPTRKSKRINNNIDDEEFLEIEREPIWH